MPRPISWLPRLHEIRRSVSNSVRSHYDRRDLESVFELQPRAAQKLLEMLPTVQVGTSRLVDREVLEDFLDKVWQTEDPSKLIDEIRSQKSEVSRRKVRSLVRRDVEPATLTSLPQSIHLRRGHITISFRTVEELAEAMYTIARLLEEDGEQFATEYEVRSAPVASEDREDIQRMFSELEDMESRRLAHRLGPDDRL